MVVVVGRRDNNTAIKWHMVPVVSLLAIPELEVIYIGRTADAAET